MTAPVAVDVLKVMEETSSFLRTNTGIAPGWRSTDVENARAAVAELIEAAAKVLALPEARKELEYLRKGIGTATPARAWLDLQQSLARCGGAQ